MNNPFHLIQHGWQLVVDSISVDDSQSPVQLESLEDRCLYDASPIASLVSLPAESVDFIDTIDHQLSDLIDLCVEAQDVCPVLPEPTDEGCFDISMCQTTEYADQSDVAQQLVIIDERVENFEQLVADLQANESLSIEHTIVRLSQLSDGIEQITALLDGDTQYDAVHIISHGSDGQLQLGSSRVTAENILEYQQQLATWTSGLNANADILLYGCEVAQTATGENFVATFSELVGADIAASDDITGYAELGGDWYFEISVGTIETNVAFSAEVQNSWSSILATYTVTNSNDSGAGSLRDAITQSNASVGVHDTIDFSIAGAGIHTIALDSELPYITDDVTLDATTQAGGSFVAPLIELVKSGSYLGIDTAAINIRANNSLVSGFIVGGFGDEGIEIDGSTLAGDNNIVELNWVGFDSTGAASGVAGDGILVTVNADNNVIRNNVVGNSGGHGIHIRTDSHDNWVWGNIVGLGTDGISDHGNTGYGVYVEGNSARNVIGTDGDATNDANEGNTISGNSTGGIYVTGLGTDDTIIAGNLIGTDSTGTVLVGNSGNNVNINSGAVDTIIGGTAAFEGNVIAGGAGDGVTIWHFQTTGTIVQGNYIGTDSTGMLDWGNAGSGVVFSGDTGSNMVGGTGLNEGNVIAFNNFGVAVWDGGTNNNAILGNSIYRNDGLGIEIQGVGVNTNDNNDIDTGANDGQNYPVFTLVSHSLGTTSVNFDFNTNQAGNYLIEFFVSDLADHSGHGEGQTLVHSQVVNHTGTGNESFAAIFSTSANAIISATATEDFGGGSYGSTSEFSAVRNAQGGGVLVVDTTNDLSNGDTSSVANLIGNKGDGLISLREAIEATNAVPGTFDIIQFDIAPGGLQTIVLTGVYQNITDTGIIDATTQFGYSGAPLIELDGTATSGSQNGITLAASASGSTVKGFIVHSFADEGIEVLGDNNIVQNNWVGLNSTGAADANLGDGIILAFGASGNLIGGSGANEGNVVSGNTGAGITLRDAGTDGNFIYGNIVGLGADGISLRGNGTDGVWLSTAVANNFVGGTAPGQANVVAGNSGSGVLVSAAGTSNAIVGNFVGTDSSGTMDLGNATHGIAVSAGSINTIIGGTTAAHRNIISGNDGQGIEIAGLTTTGTLIQGNFIGTTATGMAGLRNEGHGIRLNSNMSTTIGGTAAGARNVISGNDNSGSSADGIYISGGGSHTVQGNYVGVGSDGATALGNYSSGIAISGSNNNLIGGGVANAGNVMSGNPLYGVYITGVGADNNELQGNIIGLAADGVTTVAGGGTGAFIGSGATNNLIGTDANGTNDAGERNIISGNTGEGVRVDASSPGNTIAGNYIGTDISGTLDRGNAGDGIELFSSGNLIGGSTAAAKNVISGNDGFGIYISGAAASSNTISANYIGTNAAGTGNLANSSTGIVIEGNADNNVVGGSTTGERNLISGNIGSGILVQGVGTTGTQIVGNYIGTDVTGNFDLGNGGSGIYVTGGDLLVIHGNLVSGNDGYGIFLSSTGVTNATVTGNTIGLNVAGTASLLNAGHAVYLNSTLDAVIGGTTVADRNVINAGSGDFGIYALATFDTTITGNYIGTDALGTTMLSGGSFGIDIFSSVNTTVGGATLAHANVVGGYLNTGIAVIGAASTGTQIQGNFVGTDTSGTLDLTDGTFGITLSSSATGILIGGTGVGNTIANNSTNGIRLHTTAGSGNAFRENRIFNNGGIGIDLNADGITANDAGDGDGITPAAPNELMNFPVIYDVEISGGFVTITGEARPGATVEFFKVADDGDSNGEATDFIGSGVVGGATPGTIDATARQFSFVFSVGSLTLADSVTATATDVANNTSEFAANVLTDNAPTDLTTIATEAGGLNINDDGGNDTYFVADDGGGLLGGLTTVTIEASFSVSTPGTDLTPLLSYADGTNDEELGLFLKSDGRIWFATSTNGAAIQSTTGTYTQLFDGEIHHVAVSWDSATGAVEFYVDGASVESFTGYQTGQSVGSTGELVIGQDQDSVLGGFNTIDVFKGTLYDIRIFDDVRTAGEISTNYETTLPNTEPGMIANWTFNDLSTGGVITDSVSGNNFTEQHVGGGFTASDPELSLSVSEVAPNTTVVGNVTAIDPDVGDTFTYALTDSAGGRFAISAAGEITVANAFLIDFESANSHDITIEVTDSQSNTYSEVFTINVNDVNDAPTHGAGNISAIWEDDTNPPGETVGNLFSGTFSDPDAGSSLAGVAITSNSAPGTEGVWEYSTDGGSTWFLIGAASDAASVVFDTTARLRFLPAADFSGNPTVLTSRVLDNSYAGSFTSGATIETISTSTNGGTTAISSTLRNVSSVVIPVDDAPIISGGPDTSGLAETNAGLTDSGSLTVSDVDLTDVVTAAVDSVTVGGTGAPSVPGTLTNAILQGFLTVSPTAILDGTETTDTLTWDFNSGSEAFDFLATGETLILTYTVSATDDAGTPLSDTETVTVTITGTNDAPAVTSDGGGATAAINVAENTTAVTTVTATDPDLPADTLTYTITGGADSGDFAINSSTGVLTLVAGKDFETPSDADLDGVYEVELTVDDGNGLNDAQTISVTITDGNETPTITSDGGGATAAINVVEKMTAVTTVTATDPDLPADMLTYTITGGADSGHFEIKSSTGVLTFLSGKDFEVPSDADLDGIYEVEVTVDDGNGLNDVQTISVTITGGNEAPTINSDGGGATASLNVVENTTAVTTVTATDPDLPADTLTYTISGGADSGDFAINSSTGVLTLVAGKDFETPSDVDLDGVYEVEVTVDDGNGLNDVQTISVTITDVNETPTITSDGGGATATLNVVENTTAVTTVTATDPDLPADTLTYTITGGADSADFAINSSTGALTLVSGKEFETPADADLDGVYEVEVTVDDGNGLNDVQAISVTITDGNEAPTINSDGGGATASLNVVENTTAVTTVTATDPDLPADTLTYTISGGADSGDFAINSSTGVLTLVAGKDFETPSDADLDGVYEVEVTVDDGNGLNDIQNISATITDVNETPTITSDGGGATASLNVVENSTAVTTVTATDPDLPADTLTYTITGGADSADFAINSSTGVLTLLSGKNFETPSDADLDGVYEVQVTVDDGNGLNDVQNISVTITDVNETPTITSDGGGATAAINVAENATAVTTVAATDPDLPPDTLTYTITGGADAGDFAINSSTGVLTLVAGKDFETPSDADLDGVYEVQVTVDDGNGLNDVQDISVTITDANDAPVVTSDGGGAAAAINVAENTTAVTTMTANDQDIPADTLTYTITGGADAADFAINSSTGVLTLVSGKDFETPADADLDGVYEVQVTVDDGNGLNDVQDISVTITDVNETPTITSDGGGATASLNVVENTTAVTTVTASDPDLPGDTLTYTITGGADSGDFAINASTGVLTLVAGKDFEVPSDGDLDGIYEVEVTVDDGNGLNDVQDISVTIVDANDAPVITSDGGGTTAALNVVENTTAVTTVTATDSNLPADTLTYAITGGADAGDFAINSSTGVLTLISGKDFETPADADLDGVYEVEVTVDDGNGLNDVQTISVTITDVNETPTDISPDSFSANENIDTTGGVSIGTLVTSDVDSGDAFTYSIVGGADAGLFSIGGAGLDELILDDGVLDFETKFTYDVVVRVTDSGGLTYDENLTVNVNDLNEAPTDIAPDSVAVNETIDSSSGLSVGLLTATDEDSGETFSYSIIGGADAAKFSIGGAGFDELILTDGILDFESQSSYSVTVRVTDSGGLTYDETLTVNLNDLNENPVVNDQLFAINENTPNGTSVGFVVSSDVDAGDSATYAVVGGTGSTAFGINPATGEITVTDITQLDFETTATFTLTVEVTDTGGLTDTATITINLNDVNDEQVIATNSPLNVNEGAAGVIDATLLETTDQDHGPASLVYNVTTTPANGTLLVSGVPSLTFTQDDIDSGRLTYLHNGTETTVDSFDFTVDDGVGTVSVGTFVISINPDSDAPVANDDSFALNEGATFVGTSADTLGNDTDAEFDPLTATLVTGPANGALVLNPDGSFTYTHDGSETISDSFQYRVNDGSLDSNVATVTITVVPVNDAPVGSDDSYTTTSGVVLNELVGVLNNDTDAEFDSIIAVLAAAPANGTLLLNADGSFSYTPNTGFSGTDSFSYLPSDGSLFGNMTTVTLDVAAVPPPVIEPIDPPVEIVPPPVIDLEDPGPEKEPPPEENHPAPETKVNKIPATISATKIDDFSEFESLEEIQEYLELLADKQQAEAVLRMLVANTSPDIIQDSEDVRRLRLESGIGVAFDASYLWDQFKELEDDPISSFGIKATVGTITTVGALGYIFWSLRGGVLVAAALSQLPSWRMIDPLPVLENYASENRKTEEDIVGDFFA